MYDWVVFDVMYYADVFDLMCSDKRVFIDRPDSPIYTALQKTIHIVNTCRRQGIQSIGEINVLNP